jgi:hypothetical protein
MTELKTLDDILKQLESATEEVPMKMEDLFLNANKLFDTSPRLRFTVMNKLVKDGYTEHKELEDSKTKVKSSTYFLTYDGLIFIKKGGYQEEFKKEDETLKALKIEKTAIISVAIISSVYYSLQMIKWVLSLYCK